MIDLHLHSTNSDGTDTVELLINKVKQLGITKFAITDHNNIHSFEEVKKLSSSLSGGNGGVTFNLEYCPAAEFSTKLKDTEYHILAYGRNLQNPDIHMMAKSIKSEMENCAVEMINSITKEDHAERYTDYDYDRTRGGWKSLNYLIDLGLIENKDGFWPLLESHGPKAKYYTPAEAIEIIRSNGMFAVLAHPPAYQEGDCMPEDELTYWKDIGIMGFECYNIYYQNKENTRFYLDFCMKHNLLITGGSDYHGSFVPRELGSLMITEDKLKLGDLADEFLQI